MSFMVVSLAKRRLRFWDYLSRWALCKRELCPCWHHRKTIGFEYVFFKNENLVRNILKEVGDGRIGFVDV